LSVAYLLLNAGSKIWHADAYRPCAEHVLGFMSIDRGRRYENNDILPKMRCGDLRSVGATAGRRPIPAGRLTGCSSALVRYSDVAGVSQCDWPLRVY